ncbi:GNAT family protein [Nonomuraea sp. NPDC003804]|uniref:GNAT family N-acetyltransferase n=1 Tax=Nonomuraea sp. NPDC003804 TaxID=3154547 RepID=UPI0033A64A6A
MSDDVRLRDVEETDLELFFQQEQDPEGEYWGRGIGTAALGLFLRQERTRPLHADPFAGNTGSVRLLEKHGFQRTETVRYGEHDHIMLVLRDEG